MIGIIFGLTLFGSGSPLIRSLDNALLNWRFASAPRPASGSVAYLAIDKQTLDYVGTWPWPRSRYAELLDRLVGMGAGDIFLDVDFSTPSVPSEDARLSEALISAGGGVILPVFKQHLSADAQQTVVTQPIASFANNAWLAFANVALDADGTVRRFELGDRMDGHLVQSVAAVLSKGEAAEGTHLIDYSIAPSTIPIISLAEVMKPGFDEASLKGRSIVIGAYATELKDIFPVPVYGQLPGPMLHILAAETMLQQRLLMEGNQLPMELALAAAVIAAALALRAAPAAIPLALAFGMLLAGEACAFFLQRNYGVVIRTATCWNIVFFGFMLTLTEKVDFSRFIADVANAEQRNIRRLLRKIVTDSTDVVLAFDHRLVIFEASASASSTLGVGGATYRGQALAAVIPPVLHELVLTLAANYAKEPNTVQSAAQGFTIAVNRTVKHLEATITISPTERPDDGSKAIAQSFVGSMMIRDMTARQLYEQRLQYLSRHDELTGLVNRRAFSDNLAEAHQPLHVAAIGLHRFSVLNATMGRDVGDDLLRSVADRLRHDERICSVGRLGADVFAVAVPASVFTSEASCAQALIGLFDVPLERVGGQIYLSVRVGICFVPDNGHIGPWVEHAEQALDTAKEIAGSGWRAYEPASAERQQTSREIEYAMRDSLMRGEFFLSYQPQVDLRSGALTGAEALLRWQHPELGAISPASFVPVAEANGFICELGRWALAEACREAATWPERLTVAVNVAPIQLIRTDLVADVKQALSVSGLAACRLTLELTESAFVDHNASVIATMAELRHLGIKIALDDFGTGYSSLGYMSGFPLDKLKIDQSFVRKMTRDSQTLAIVQTVKALAGGLGLEVVAEGVEDEAEWTLLKAMGCEFGQGYFFGKPQTSAQLLSLLHQAPWIAAA
jgi:diguanylate cyclase (GGDEF)-like protein